MRSSIVRGLVAVAVTTMCLLVPRAASADPVDSTTVISSTVPIPAYGAPNQYRTILRITPTLAAGGRYYFRGRWTVTSSTSNSTMQGTFIRCTPPGANATQSVYTTTNHVPSVSSRSTAEVRWAYLPTVSGVHTCELMGYAVRLEMSTGSRQFTTVPGAANTYLFTNDSGFADLEEWRSDSTETLPHESGPFVLRKTYTPRAGTTMLRAHSDLEATEIRKVPLRATSWRVAMYVTQLNADGTACSADSTTVIRRVTDLDPGVVHFKTAIEADVPIVSGGTHTDCVRRFAIKTQAVWVSGMDVRLEAALYSNALAWSYNG